MQFPGMFRRAVARVAAWFVGKEIEKRAAEVESWAGRSAPPGFREKPRDGSKSARNMRRNRKLRNRRRRSLANGQRRHMEAVAG